MRTPHRCGGKTLQDLPRARDNYSKAESPQTTAHQIHPNQPWNEKVNITSARLRDLRFTNVHYIGSPFASLQNIVNLKSGSATLRSRWIETIFECVINRLDYNRHFPASQRLRSFVRTQH